MNAPSNMLLTTIVITGPVGSGKTTTAGRLSELLREQDVSHALIDADQIRSFYPETSDDPFNHQIAMKNIAAMSQTFAEAGARWLIVADVIEHDGHREAYARAIPTSRIVVVRLNVDFPSLEKRLRQREAPERVEWYLKRAPELQELMERNGVGDLVIDIDNHTPHDVAGEIMHKLDIS
jgi:adenylylsulfate kinase-like enzyme